MPALGGDYYVDEGALDDDGVRIVGLQPLKVRARQQDSAVVLWRFEQDSMVVGLVSYPGLFVVAWWWQLHISQAPHGELASWARSTAQDVGGGQQSEDSCSKTS